MKYILLQIYISTTYFPKFSPSCKVSGSVQPLVSGNNNAKAAPRSGIIPNNVGGSQVFTILCRIKKN